MQPIRTRHGAKIDTLISARRFVDDNGFIPSEYFCDKWLWYQVWRGIGTGRTPLGELDPRASANRRSEMH
jgi:hypothetical protein